MITPHLHFDLNLLIMKTTFLLPIIALLAVCSTYSQNKDFEFNRLNTRLLTLKGTTAQEIYSVSYSSIEESVNPEYTKLKDELEKVIADSLYKRAAYDKALARVVDMSIIKNKVIAFNNSKESYGKKVVLLKEAQILASRHNMTDLFYSDNEINKEKKAGFILLTLNLDDLKAHLNKILLRLDDKIKMPEIPTYVSSAPLRKKIYSTKKYIKGSNDANKCMVQNTMVPAEEVSGNFEVVSSYYVVSVPIRGFLKNQLVSKKTVSNLGITKSKLYSPKEKLLIQNKRTKEMYLVDNSFIDTFSIKS